MFVNTTPQACDSIVIAFLDIHKNEMSQTANQYQLIVALTGHENAINCLSLDDTGRLLVSGGSCLTQI